jgi:hypothetical protein
VHSVNKKSLQQHSNGDQINDHQKHRSAKTTVQITQSTPTKRQRSQHSTSLSVKSALNTQQRTLGDFFGAFLPQPVVNSSSSTVDSIEL